MEKSHKNKSSEWIYVLFGVIFLIVAAVIVILFLIQGKTTYVSGGDIDVTESLTCEGSSVVYPFLSYDNNETERDIKINIFLENDTLSKISLVYKLYFAESSLAEKASDRNSVALAKAFAKDGIDYDAFNKKISTLPDSSQLSLYTNNRELNAITAKYFLLEEAAGSYGINSLTNALNNKGLNCIINK